MPDQGTNVPSSKLTAAGVAAVIVEGVVAFVQHRYGFAPEPWLVDAAALVIAGLVGYWVPELNPPVSAVQALRRRL